MTDTTAPEPTVPATDSDTTVITVAGAEPYPVLIGRGLVAGVADQLGAEVRKVLIVYTSTLGARAVALRESLLDRYEVLIAAVPDAEAA